MAFFTDLDQALLFSHISKENALSLQEKVFQQLSVEEINFYQKIFIEYVKENGSITKGADNLFIHKNTFQNKLNQLHTKTGYNPRDLKDFAILYMAFVLRDYWK